MDKVYNFLGLCDVRQYLLWELFDILVYIIFYIVECHSDWHFYFR